MRPAQVLAPQRGLHEVASYSLFPLHSSECCPRFAALGAARRRAAARAPTHAAPAGSSRRLRWRRRRAAPAPRRRRCAGAGQGQGNGGPSGRLARRAEEASCRAEAPTVHGAWPGRPCCADSSQRPAGPHLAIRLIGQAHYRHLSDGWVLQQRALDVQRRDLRGGWGGGESGAEGKPCVFESGLQSECCSAAWAPHSSSSGSAEQLQLTTARLVAAGLDDIHRGAAQQAHIPPLLQDTGISCVSRAGGCWRDS